MDNQSTDNPIERDLASDDLPLVSYIPAGMFYQNHGGQAIYIKWRGHGEKYGTRILSANPANLHMVLPDREVCLVTNLNRMDGFSSFDWDECIPLSLFHEGVGEGRGPNGFMVNAHQNMQKLKRSHNTRKNPRNPFKRLTIYGDSGGYQLRRKSAFIDPHSVAEFYNDNVDRGIVLDFPLYDPFHWDNLEASAQIQKKNTEVLLAECNRDVNLVNVAHGIETKHRLDFLDIVHEDSIHSFSVTNKYYSDGIIGFIHGIAELIDGVKKRYGDHYKHMHILGLGENKLYWPLMRMAAKGLLGGIELSMDSSTHLQTATSKTYFNHTHSLRNVSNLRIGDDLNYPNPMMTLPCSCPACSAIGWMDGYNVMSGQSAVVFPLMYHNIFAMDAYFRQMLWFAKHSDTQQITEMTNRVFRSDRNVAAEIVQAFNYIDTLEQEGLKATAKRYSFYVDYEKNSSVKTFTTTETLLGSFIDIDPDEIEGNDHSLVDSNGVNREYFIIDKERIDTYNNRLYGLYAKRRHKLDNDFKDDGSGRPKKTRKTSAGFVKPKGKRKETVVEEVKKVINNVKARTGASLKKVKQKERVKTKPKPTEVRILGKVVRKSANKKRL